MPGPVSSHNSFKAACLCLTRLEYAHSIVRAVQILRRQDGALCDLRGGGHWEIVHEYDLNPIAMTKGTFSLLPGSIRETAVIWVLMMTAWNRELAGLDGLRPCGALQPSGYRSSGSPHRGSTRLEPREIPSQICKLGNSALIGVVAEQQVMRRVGSLHNLDDRLDGPHGSPACLPETALTPARPAPAVVV